MLVSKPRSVPSKVPLPAAATVSPNTLVMSTVGAVASMVTALVLVLMLPSLSLRLTLMFCTPSPKPTALSNVPDVGVTTPVSTLQLPVASVMTV